MIFQNPVNYLEDEFQIKKMKSYNDAPSAVKMHDVNIFNKSTNNIIGDYEKNQKVMSFNDNEFDDQSNQFSNKKRSRKAYTKKNKKRIEEESQSKNQEAASFSDKKDSTEKSGAENTTTLMDKKSTSVSVRFAPEIEEA